MISKLLCWWKGDGKPKVRRDPGWAKLRKEHLAKQPACLACGSKKSVVPHHIIPVDWAKELELQPENLVTLCEGDVVNCHLLYGHHRHWRSYNPDVVEHAQRAYKLIQNRPKPKDDDTV